MQLTTSYQQLKQVYLGNTGYSNVYLRLYAKYNSQDITNNRTNVSVQLRVYTESAWWMQQSGGLWAVGLTDNTTISGYANQRFEVGETTLGTLTGNVNHNSDGTKTNCACLGSVNFTEWGFVGNCDTTASLPTIPRASKLNSATMSISTNGNSVSVTANITKNVSSYYDSLIIKNGSTTIATLDNITHNTAKSLSSAQISSLYSAIGTATSKTFTCYIATYSNSSKTKLIGNSSNVNLTATLPNYSISLTATITDTVTTYNTYKGSGNENKKYIANLSKPKFDFTATSSTGSYYGRSVSYKLGNTAISDHYTVNNYTGQSFSFTATDGRKTSSAYVPSSPNYIAIPYFKPTLNANVSRLTPTGDKINVSISGSYYDGNGLTNLRTPTAILTYTSQGGTQQQVSLTLNTTINGHTVNFTASTQLTGMNYQKKVTWSIVLTDRIGITANKGNTLPQGLPVWNAYRKNDKNYFHVNGNFSADEFYDRVWDVNTNNTTDTWVPVMAGGYWQHRVIPTDFNSTSKFLSYKGDAGTNLNNTRTHGTYSYGTNTTTNKPSGAGSYGIINVYVSGAGTWSPSDQSSWIWQEVRDTSGNIYVRNAVNSETFSAWKQIAGYTLLYDNSSGTNGTVTLNETSANFTYIEIFFALRSSNVNYFASVRVYSPNGKVVSLASFNPQSNVEVLGLGRYTISGTTVTKNYVGSYVSFGSPSATNEIYVYRINGYR